MEEAAKNLTNTQPVEPASAATQAFTDTNIKQILLDQKYLDAKTLASAEEYAAAHHVKLVEYLLSQNIISKELLGQAIAESYGINFADLEKNQPSRELIRMLPPEYGEYYRMILYGLDNNVAAIATDNPMRAGLSDILKQIFPQRQISIAYALPEDLDDLLIHYKKPLATRFNQIIQSETRVAPEIIDEIIKDAIAYKVSDIHFEPLEEVVIVRFRVDGVLHEAGQFPKQYYDNILNRLKVQSHMRIDEHNSAQDGAIRYKIDEQPLDIRISIVPVLDGEKVALRLLGEYSRNLSFKNLGFSVTDQKIVAAQIHRPFGMIVTTGPTGSGKTTTLYSLLRVINNPEINITTIEDPVEYKISGVNQIQVKRETNLTFANGMRSIVRQNPDVILVGEIRDMETAKLAVNAALTGHLLLSTFHANDAATAIPRFIDMGVEPFLLASTLNVVIAQRLVRVIHEQCRASRNITPAELAASLPNLVPYLKPDATGHITLYYGKGCGACNHTGYKGRTSIFELISITREMKELILSSPTSEQIWDLARRQGARTLFEDGIEKVRMGRTSLEELMRVAEPKQ